MEGDAMTLKELLVFPFVGMFSLIMGLGTALLLCFAIAQGVKQALEYEEYILKELKYKVLKRENGKVKIDDYC